MLKREFMPEATQKNFDRLCHDPRLSGFTLVGGTALALQIGHRISEDLDFNVFGQRLPQGQLDALLEVLIAEGVRVESLISSDAKSAFKINTGRDLDHEVQDYLIDGAKVTFHSRHAGDRPTRQIEFLKSCAKVKVSNTGFDVLGIDGLCVMKSIVVYDRVKSRDLYDLMLLSRDHGYTLAHMLSAVDAYQPARHKDPEHFKNVVTGIMPLDANDEGFASIQLNVRLNDIYKYFKKLVNDYEVNLVHQLL